MEISFNSIYWFVLSYIYRTNELCTKEWDVDWPTSITMEMELSVCLSFKQMYQRHQRVKKSSDWLTRTVSMSLNKLKTVNTKHQYRWGLGQFSKLGLSKPTSRKKKSHQFLNRFDYHTRQWSLMNLWFSFLSITDSDLFV